MAIKTPEAKNEQTKVESKNINIDELEEVQESVQVDFSDETLANDFASQKTKPTKDIPQVNPNKSAEDIKNEVLEYEQNKSGKLEYKDLLKQAEFFINMFDVGMSTVFNFISRGDNSRDYRMQVEDKRVLSGQLALILSKYQDKFKVEYSFFLGLIIMYSPMAATAFKERKKNSPKNKTPKTFSTEQKEEKKNSFQYRHKGEQQVETPTHEDNFVEKFDVPSQPPQGEDLTVEKPKRKRGQKQKAY